MYLDSILHKLSAKMYYWKQSIQHLFTVQRPLQLFHKLHILSFSVTKFGNNFVDLCLWYVFPMTKCSLQYLSSLISILEPLKWISDFCNQLEVKQPVWNKVWNMCRQKRNIGWKWTILWSLFSAVYFKSKAEFTSGVYSVSVTMSSHI
jgi:hypothetical protein